MFEGQLMRFTCPVCFFPDLPYTPGNYHICPCCGTEFGNDDHYMSHAELRREWISRGANWFFRRPPEYWNPWMQLISGSAFDEVPKFATKIISSVNVTISPTQTLNVSSSPWFAQVA
jgi:hypothetical protein